jgi:hypothetical protein
MKWTALALALLLAAAGMARASVTAAPLDVSGAVHVRWPGPDGKLREEIALRASFDPAGAAFDPGGEDLLLEFEIPGDSQAPQPCFIVWLPAGCFTQGPDGHGVPDLAMALQCGLFTGVVKDLDVPPGQQPVITVIEDLTGALTHFRARLAPEAGGGWALRIDARALEPAQTPEPCFQPRLGSAHASALTLGDDRWAGVLRRSAFAHAGPMLLAGGGQAQIGEPGPNGVREIRERWRLDAAFDAGQAVFNPALEGLRIELEIGGGSLPQPCFFVWLPPGCLVDEGGGFRMRSLPEALQLGLQVGVERGQVLLEDLTPALTDLRLLLAPGANGRRRLRLDAAALEHVHLPDPCFLPKLGAAYESRLRIGDDAWSARTGALGFQHLPQPVDGSLDLLVTQ